MAGRGIALYFTPLFLGTPDDKTPRSAAALIALSALTPWPPARSPPAFRHRRRHGAWQAQCAGDGDRIRLPLCPHCAAFNNTVFPAFKAKYIDTGKIDYVFREALVADPAIAAASFLTARCAGKDKYFQVLDRGLPRRRPAFGNPGGRCAAILLQIAEQARPERGAVQRLHPRSGGAEALNDRWQSYVCNNKIEQTPTFVINGVTYKGDLTLAQLDAAIAKAGKPAT